MSHGYYTTRILNAIFVLFFVFGLTVVSFGQKGDLQNDLQTSFKDFSLVKLNNRTVLSRIETGGAFSIQTAARNFELDLTPNDLRSPRYRAENTDGGTIQAIGKDAPVTTFKGKVAGEINSQARMSIDGGEIEGYFISGGEMFVLEAARKFSGVAGAEDYVVYRQTDLVNPQSFDCAAGVGEKIEQGKNLVAANTFQSPQTLRVLEVATEADFEFVNLHGGVAPANAEILNILNMVDGVYERELGLTVSVVYQHTWTTPDNFNGATTNALIVSFRDYWNANYPSSQVLRDSAHLFSGKTSVAAQGLSYIAVTCRNPNFAYGLSGRVDIAPLKFDLTAHEIAHNIGATHTDAVQSCGNTLMNTIITEATQFSFCPFSRTEIAAFIQTNGGCLGLQEILKNKFDYDGDGRADISVYRPSTGVWYLLNSQAGFFAAQFGILTDKPIAADYDGDGRTDLAVYRPQTGIWYLLRSRAGFGVYQFGSPEDVPQPADFDGDGRAELAVYRPSTGVWYVLNLADNQFTTQQFGAPEDKPVASDYDGDGRADYAVYRPSSGVWYLLQSRDGFLATQFGAREDKPVAGDYDADGKTDLAVYRPSNGVWYLLQSRAGFLARQFGESNDAPTPADYDGDGRTDLAVYRSSSGVWYLLQSRAGFFAEQFGAERDVAIPNAFVP